MGINMSINITGAKFMTMNPKILNDIIEALKNSDRDLTISEIAEITKHTRATIRTYIAYLLGQGKVIVTRQIGRAKFFRLKEP